MKKPNPHNPQPQCPRPPFFPGTVFVNDGGGQKQKDRRNRRKQREEREEFLRGGK